MIGFAASGHGQVPQVGGNLRLVRSHRVGVGRASAVGVGRASAVGVGRASAVEGEPWSQALG